MELIIQLVLLIVIVPFTAEVIVSKAEVKEVPLGIVVLATTISEDNGTQLVATSNRHPSVHGVGAQGSVHVQGV